MFVQDEEGTRVSDAGMGEQTRPQQGLVNNPGQGLAAMYIRGARMAEPAK
jgi:hypothetical protein